MATEQDWVYIRRLAKSASRNSVNRHEIPWQVSQALLVNEYSEIRNWVVLQQKRCEYYPGTKAICKPCSEGNRLKACSFVNTRVLFKTDDGKFDLIGYVKELPDSGGEFEFEGCNHQDAVTREEQRWTHRMDGVWGIGENVGGTFGNFYDEG